MEMLTYYKLYHWTGGCRDTELFAPEPLCVRREIIEQSTILKEIKMLYKVSLSKCNQRNGLEINKLKKR